jgi:hypothetical protein
MGCPYRFGYFADVGEKLLKACSRPGLTELEGRLLDRIFPAAIPKIDV